MKAVVIGGAGVFGERVVRLLAADGHAVTVAGRSLVKAQLLADDLGAAVLAMDRAGALDALWAAKPDVVVDAAGPFHAYGDDPYRLPRACVAHGVHYLDLADDAAFCQGISALDGAAQAAGVWVISGASSVPAISSAVVADLARGADEIDTISSAILPGNRAPRGRAVVESILHQTGQPMQFPVDGQQVIARGWSRPALFDLGAGLRRKGWMIGVPDQALFAGYFGARSVLFRAGLELGVMNHAMAVLSWLRGRWRFRIRPWMVTGLLWLANLLRPLGSDRGGMVVSVTARWGQDWRERRWQVIAAAGAGPSIPAVAVRAILRAPDMLAPGARPALAVITRAAAEAAMDDLDVRFETETQPCTPIFQSVLGDSFRALPPSLQQAHLTYGPRRWQGRGSVTRGAGLWPRLLAWVFRFPKATDDIAVTVTMTPQMGGERWVRQFGSAQFASFLRPKAGRMTEKFGPLTFTLGLHVDKGRLHYPVHAGRLGPLPLPGFLLPQSRTCEYEKDGRFHFDVALMAPLTGQPMVHYRGWLSRSSD